jgi:hypothetical protein
MTNRFLENLVLMLYNSYSIFVAKSKKKQLNSNSKNKSMLFDVSKNRILMKNIYLISCVN